MFHSLEHLRDWSEKSKRHTFFHKKCVQMIKIHHFRRVPDSGTMENDEMTHFFAQKVCPFWSKSRNLTKIPIVIHIRNWWFWENQTRSNKTEVKMIEILEIQWKWSIRHTFFLKKCVGLMKSSDFLLPGRCNGRFGLDSAGLDCSLTQHQSGSWTALNWNELD